MAEELKEEIKDEPTQPVQLTKEQRVNMAVNNANVLVSREIKLLVNEIINILIEQPKQK